MLKNLHAANNKPLATNNISFFYIDGAQFINYNYKAKNNKNLTANSFSQITVKLF